MYRRQQQIRLNNLERLIQETGSAAALARAAKTSASYLSQVRNRLPSTKGTPRAIGDDLADRLEQGMALPSGWLDEDRDDKTLEPPARAFAPSTCALLPLISWQQVQRRSSPKQTQIGAQTRQLCCPIPCSDESFILEIQGSSMEPKFRDGEYIFADPTLKPKPNHFVIAKIKGSKTAMLRQFIIDSGKGYLQALNPDWPDRIIEINENVSLHAVVVFRGEPV